MATIDLSAVNANFAFADNPIIVKAKELGFIAGSIFRQVVFNVETYYNKSDSNKRTFTFAVNAEGGVTEVSCDISSALRSTFAAYQYNADAVSSTGSITYPAVTFKVSVYTKWMLDGIADHSGTVTDNTTYIAFLGGLSDIER